MVLPITGSPPLGQSTPFEFYNETTPITEVDANPTSLVLSVNTSLLLRGGTVPYNNLQLNSTNNSFSPVTININTGIQTITISSLTANTPYTVNITVSDSSSPTQVSLTSSNQSFTTAYPALVPAVIALGTISEENRTNSQLPYVVTINPSGGSGSLTDEWQYKLSSVGWPGSPLTEGFDNTLLSVTAGYSYDVRVKTTDGAGTVEYSNTVTATLYDTLTLGDGSVSPPAQSVNIDQVATISIDTGNLFNGGQAPYRFDVNGLTQSPLNFVLNLTESDIVGNQVDIISATYSFTQAQTTYLISNNRTLVYKWTSGGSPGLYTYSLELTSADGQTYDNILSSPFSVTLEPSPA